MTGLCNITLCLAGEGEMRLRRSAPFDRDRKTVGLISPIGTECRYLDGATSFLAERFNVVAFEGDSLVSFALATGKDVILGAGSFTQALCAAMPEPFRLNSLVGYCSSAPLAMAIATRAALDSVLLLNGYYSLAADDIVRTQYERDVENMVYCAQRNGVRDLYPAVRFLYDRDPYPEGDLRRQRVRPFRNLESFQQYVDFLGELSRINVSQAARCMGMPTLVWSGRNDQFTDPSSSRHIARLLERGESFEDPEGRHHDFVDGNLGLYRAMSRFLMATD